MTTKSPSQPLKKRGRRPKKSEHDSSDPATSSDAAACSTPTILQLVVNTNASACKNEPHKVDTDFESSFYQYNPSVDTPFPYSSNNSQFESKPFELGEVVANVDSDRSNVHLIMKNHLNGSTLPSMSKHACYWCAHTFTNPMVGLPVRQANGVFYVTGNYCSLECACANNFEDAHRENNTWDVYAMINSIARKLGASTPVYPAPPRKCLSYFGGYMSIDEFRSHSKKNTIPCCTQYPLVAVVEQVEEINNFYHKQETNEQFLIDNERIAKYETRLKLQQDASIQSNLENTLDHSMGFVTVRGK